MRRGLRGMLRPVRSRAVQLRWQYNAEHGLLDSRQVANFFGVHNVTGLVGFVSAIAGIFVISRGLKGDPFWRRFHRFSLVVGFATLVSLLLWIGVAKAAQVDSLNGLLQRLFIGFWFLWVEVIAIRMFQLSRQSPSGKAT